MFVISNPLSENKLVAFVQILVTSPYLGLWTAGHCRQHTHPFDHLSIFPSAHPVIIHDLLLSRSPSPFISQFPAAPAEILMCWGPTLPWVMLRALWCWRGDAGTGDSGGDRCHKELLTSMQPSAMLSQLPGLLQIPQQQWARVMWVV